MRKFRIVVLAVSLAVVCLAVCIGSGAISFPTTKHVQVAIIGEKAAVTTATGRAVVVGDVNGDQAINNKDLALLLKYTNGQTVSMDTTAADVNADGAIDEKDVGLMQRYVNGWGVEWTVELPRKGYTTADKRIKIGDISLGGNTVTIEIKNVSVGWETEEDTSYFEYTCYDSDNNPIAIDKIAFGFITAKQSKVCTFTIPWNTARVELTDFHAEYWTSVV